MIYPKFKSRIDSGKLIMEGQVKDIFDGYLKTQKDGFYEVSIKPWSEKRARSNEQNRYYWGVVIPLISENTGYTKDETHEILKIIFLSKVIYVGTHKVRIAASTSELSTVGMESYLSEIRSFASIELGINIPEPNEVSY